MLKIGDKKLINAWAFYDWANSVYSLVISTAIFPLFYSAVTDGETIYFLGTDWQHPDALYSYALSFSFLVVAFISPILSAIADYTGNKKRFLQVFCLIGSLSVMSLYFFKDLDTIWVGIVFSILASIGFWGSIVFYNSYLPEVAHPEDQDRVSAKGFIYGYLGSVILLILCLVLILSQEVDADKLKMMRYSFVLVGIWWIGFAQFTFKRLPNNVFNKKPDRDIFWKGFKELRMVMKEVKNYPTLKGFLVAFFLLSVGVQTIILMASIFGSQELGLDSTGLIITILVIQLVAIGGASLFSNLSKKYGNFKALKISLFIWMVVCFGAFMLHKDLPNVDIYFYALGGVLGLVLGAIQSLSRSTYSKLLPETEDHATYFSFFDVTEKIAIVFGTFIFGFLSAKTGSMQWSALSLAIFFVAAFVVLSFLKGTKYVK
ncbi:MFS transporter [Pseudotenacibaculum haliotis]|uniref:MFS transporter n=1 Tax=Pseudotenacibaculum haliotis TaxID=1862138 RepID=A0ABW5LVJ2_9FLAO